ncbi:hypothetical protein GCM10010282_07760 [Streptomyces roseolus]|nr:hypothetical protein GCM10010282_07760 [Streptomyces roseolus]
MSGDRAARLALQGLAAGAVAFVLWKDDRIDHLRIPDEGWDHVSGRAHRVERGLPPRHMATSPRGAARQDMSVPLQAPDLRK